MTFNEAIEKVLELVPDEKLSEFSETIDVIKNSQSADVSGEDWEKKYKELSAEYRKRFLESLNKDVLEDEERETEEEEEEDVDIRDLDFSADTE